MAAEDTLEAIAEWYVRNAGTYLASPMQLLSDLTPFSLDDAYRVTAYAGACAVALVSSIRVAQHVSGTRKLRTPRRLIKGGLYALTLTAVLVANSWVDAFRPPLERRWGITRPETIDNATLAADAKESAQECLRLFREYGLDSAPIPSASLIENRVVRSLRAHGEPTVWVSGRVKRSERFLRDYAVGATNAQHDPLFREVYLGVPEDNFHSIYKVAHEMAHKHFIHGEDEASLVAYLALVESDEPILQAAAHAYRATQARAELLGVPGAPLISLPRRVTEDMDRIRQSREGVLAAGSAPLEQVVRSVGETMERIGAPDRFAALVTAVVPTRPAKPQFTQPSRYTSGFLSLLHAYEAAHGGTVVARR